MNHGQVWEWGEGENPTAQFADRKKAVVWTTQPHCRLDSTLFFADALSELLAFPSTQPLSVRRDAPFHTNRVTVLPVLPGNDQNPD